MTSTTAKIASEAKARLAEAEEDVVKARNERTQVEEEFLAFSDSHDAKVTEVREKLDKYKAAHGDCADAGNGVAINNELRDEIDCICCYETMTEQILQCTKGHLICQKCQARLRDCPVCRERYSQPPIRNRLAETLAKVAIATEGQELKERPLQRS